MSLIPASLLEAEKVKYERRSQKVLGILRRKDEKIQSLEIALQKCQQQGAESPESRNARERERETFLQREQRLLSKVKDQAEQIEVLVSEVATLRQRQGERQARQASEKLEEKWLDLQVQNERLNREKVALEEQLEKERAERKKAEQKREEHMQNERDKHATRVKELEGLLATAKRAALQDEAQLTRARQRIRELSDQSEHREERQLDLHVRQLQTQLEEAHARVSDLQKSYDAVVKENQRAKDADRTQLETGKNLALENIVMQQSQELVSLRAKLVAQGAKERKLVSDAEFERRSLLNKVRNLEAKLRKASENGVVQRKQLESTIRVLSGKSELHNKISEQAEQLSMLTNAKADLELKVQLAREENKDLREQLTSCRATVLSLEKDLNSFRKASVYADVPAKSRKAMLERVALELEQCKVEKEALEDQLESIFAATSKSKLVARMGSESGTQRGRGDSNLIDTQEDDVEEVEEGHPRRLSYAARLRFRVRSLEARLQAKGQEVEMLEGRVMELQEEMDKLKSRQEQETLRLEQQHSEQLATINRRIVSHIQEKQVFAQVKENMTKELEIAKANQLQCQNRLAQGKREFLKRLEEMALQVEQLETKNDTLSAECKIAKMQQEEGQNRLVYLEETLRILQDEYGSEGTQHERLISELASKLNQTDHARAKLASECETVRQQMEQLNREKTKLEQAKRRLEWDCKERQVLLDEEVEVSKALRNDVISLERQVEELKQSNVNLELKSIELNVSVESLACERDRVRKELEQVTQRFETLLAQERKSCAEAVRDYELSPKSEFSPLFEGRKIQLEQVVHDLVQAHRQVLGREQRTALEGLGQVPFGADASLRAFEQLAQTVLDAETERLRQEGENRAAAWRICTLETKIKDLQAEKLGKEMEKTKHAAHLEQLERLREVESSLRQMNFERRLRAECKRTESVEALFVRANGQLRAMAGKCRLLQFELEKHGIKVPREWDENAADDRGDLGANSMVDLFSELHAVRSRNQALETELADALGRLEEFRVASDGEDEKKRLSLEREKKHAQALDQEVHMLREKLQSSKKELVNLAFEYETKLMMAKGGHSENAGIPSIVDLGSLNELQRRTLDQAKEISDLHEQIAEQQRDLAKASARERELQDEVSRLIHQEEHQQVFGSSSSDNKPRDSDGLRAKLETLAERTNAVLLEQKESQIARLREEAEVLSSRLVQAAEVNRTLSAANAKIVDALQKYEKYFEQKADKKKKQGETMFPGDQGGDNDDGTNDGSVSSVGARLESFLALMRGKQLQSCIRQLRLVLDRYADEPEVAEAKAQVGELKTQVAVLETKLQDMNEHSADVQERLEAQLKTVQSDLEQREAWIDDLKEQVKRLEKESDSFGIECKQLSEENLGLTERVQELEALEERYKEREEYLKDEMETVKIEMEQCRKEKQELQVQVSVYEAELDDLRTITESTNAQIVTESERTNLEQAIEDKSGLIETLRTKLKKQEAKAKGLEKRLEGTKASLERTTEQLGAIKKAWYPPEAADKLKADVTKLKEELRKARSQTQRKSTLLTAALEKTNVERTQDTEWRTKLAKLEGRLRQAEQDALSKETLANAHKSSLEELRAAHETLGKDLAKVKDKLERAKREKTALSSKVQLLQDKLEESRHHTVSHHSSLAPQPHPQPHFVSADGGADVKQQHSSREKLVRLKAKVVSFEAQVSTLRDKLTKAEEQERQMNQEMSQLKDASASQKKRIKGLEKDVETATGKLRQLEGLARAKQEEVMALGRSMASVLCQLADESIEIKRHLYDMSRGRQVNNRDHTVEHDGIASMVGKIIDFTEDDMRDLFGAEARSRDPVFSADMDNLKMVVSRHKSMVNQLLLEPHARLLSVDEMDHLVNATVGMWRLATRSS